MVLWLCEAEVVLDDARPAVLLLVAHGLPRARGEPAHHGVARLRHVIRQEAGDACDASSLLQALLNLELLAVGAHGFVVRQPREGSVVTALLRSHRYDVERSDGESTGGAVLATWRG